MCDEQSRPAQYPNPPLPIRALAQEGEPEQSGAAQSISNLDDYLDVSGGWRPDDAGPEVIGPMAKYQPGKVKDQS